MVTYTMQGKVMIYLSPRVHELRVRSRDAIVSEALRSALVSGDHPKKPIRGVSEHASMCTRLHNVASQHKAAIPLNERTVPTLSAGGHHTALHMAGAGPSIAAWPARTRPAKTAAT